jgi:hypothetical protein
MSVFDNLCPVKPARTPPFHFLGRKIVVFGLDSCACGEEEAESTGAGKERQIYGKE